jgi:hypothetical protein
MCRQQDVVVSADTMELVRTSVVWTWARIKSYYGVPAFMSQAGYAIIDPHNRATHAVTIRGGLEIDITATAWIYEKRRKSAPRWYKILGFTDPVGWIHMTARLIEKSDLALPPLSPLSPQQLNRVEL